MNPVVHVIPHTATLLARIMRPKRRTISDKVDAIFFVVFLSIIMLLLISVGLLSNGWVSGSAIQVFGIALLISLAIGFGAWGGFQIYFAVQGLRKGFAPAAGHIDVAIERERELVTELALCDVNELRERSRHLELESKLLKGRSGLVAILVASGVALANLLDAAERTSFWSTSLALKPFIYAGSIGVLLGSAVVVVLASRLERIAGLLSLAADRGSLAMKARVTATV